MSNPFADPCAQCGAETERRCEACLEPVCSGCVVRSEDSHDNYPDIVWCRCIENYHEPASEPQRTFLR